MLPITTIDNINGLCNASSTRKVSSSDSPFFVDELTRSILSVSADNRFAASSKAVRVRVLFSKNRLATVFPRNSGTFLIDLSLTLVKPSAVSRIWVNVVLSKPSILRKWCSLLNWLNCGSDWNVERMTDNIGPDGQLVSGTLYQCGKCYSSRSPVVKNFVHRSAHGATGADHIID